MLLCWGLRVEWATERVCVCVCLTAVDSLEAKVISRFPLRPSRAGTRMKISVMYWNASQCCRHQKVTLLFLAITELHTYMLCFQDKANWGFASFSCEAVK